MVLHYLTIWGCPQDLLTRLSPPQPSTSSRPLLLALAWLVAQCRLFQRALARTQLPLQLLQLLPPFPQVRCYELLFNISSFRCCSEGE